MPILQDLTGKKYGKLTALKRVGNTKYGHVMWSCVCECGKTKDFNGSDLRKGIKKSCGCAGNTRVYYRSSRTLYKDARNMVLSAYQSNAKNKNRLFNIPEDKFFELTQKNCEYCGNEPQTIASPKNPNSTLKQYVYNGIDRVNSAEGYTVENCVPCCSICNRMKMNHTKKDWYAHMCKIISRK